MTMCASGIFDMLCYILYYIQYIVYICCVLTDWHSNVISRGISVAVYTVICSVRLPRIYLGIDSHSLDILLITSHRQRSFVYSGLLYYRYVQTS